MPRKLQLVSLLCLTLASASCSDDDASARTDAADTEIDVPDAEGEADAEPEPELDAGGTGEGTVPLTVWVDDLIEHRTSDEAEPDTVDDKKISDDTDETSFDKYLP